jgi:hypothetical protein
MRTPLGYVGLLIKCLLFLSLAVLVLSIGGFITSQVHNAVSTSMPSADDSVSAYRAYGELPIPGTQTVHLPAGQVAITFHAVTVGIPEAGLPVPDLKLEINPPAGVADPQVTENMGGTTSFNNDAWRRVWIAQITQEGDYQITTDGQVTAFVSAGLAFGHVDVSPPSAASPSSPYGYLSRFSRIAFAVALATLIGCVLAVRILAGRANSPEFQADLLASGQRVPGVLNAFRDTGRTPRSLGKTPSRPEFVDDPLFILDVQLELPDRASVRSRSVQRVPRTQVPNLAVGRQLMCVVDPAKPARRLVVDWGDIFRGSAAGQSGAAEGAEEQIRSLIESATGAAPSDVAVAAAAPPPTAVTQSQSIARRMQELETLRAAGAISDAEYAARRQQIIAEI